MPLNHEFKARASQINRLEDLLKKENPRFVGTDYQTDVYFRVPTGRLKLRRGNIENSLIHYERENLPGAKASKVLLYRHEPDAALEAILRKTMEVLVEVKKERKIYFIDRVKFHFDRVEGLGSFIEVEVIDRTDTIAVERLAAESAKWAAFFGIREEDYVAVSYSDLLLQKTAPPKTGEAV